MALRKHTGRICEVHHILPPSSTGGRGHRSLSPDNPQVVHKFVPRLCTGPWDMARECGRQASGHAWRA